MVRLMSRDRPTRGTPNPVRSSAPDECGDDVKIMICWSRAYCTRIYQHFSCSTRDGSTLDRRVRRQQEGSMPCSLQGQSEGSPTSLILHRDESFCFRLILEATTDPAHQLLDPSSWRDAISAGAVSAPTALTDDRAHSEDSRLNAP